MLDELRLGILDTTGIQDYIFGSNRLRENVGASHLVYQATQGWLLNQPSELLHGRHNIRNGERQDFNDVGLGHFDAELIYAGGGNAVILFRTAGDARHFADKLSRKLLCDAPGLDAVFVTEAVTPDGSLAQGLHRAMTRLSDKKREREWSHPLLGLGVTAACRSTGLVGSYVEPEPGEDERKIVISAEVKAKWNQNAAAKDRLRKELLREQQPMGLDFPDQFDHLGRMAGEQSYIAVVHADGNNMGKTLEAITERFLNATGDDNRKYITALRKFSDKANQAGMQALKRVVGKVVDWNTTRVVEPTVDRSQRYLSIRPLVYGGDDVTFVCDGRIGLRAAQVYLEAFNQQAIPDAEGHDRPGLAAAGIAIVKVRYPFVRAYRLSEELCQSAKNCFKREVPALDWHLAQSGLFGSLREIRSREYNERWDGADVTHSLLMRPVSLGEESPSHWYTWRNFSQLLDEFQTTKRWPRNKVIALREALRAGEEVVRNFVINYDRKLPSIETAATQYRETGWDGGRCVYFDAIEMIDQEVPA